MKIKLIELALSNFKGIKKFTLTPKDKCQIRGANAAGKTTLMDAFLWLLFGKDSQGKADFAIKTLKGGEEIPNLEHSVEGVFDIDHQVLTLKKVLKEIWTKKRGSATREFTGHTTDYYIDGVPVQKKEWDQQISDTINEETFKLLTSPTYFNQSLHWEKRRALLLEVCGDISDSDIIASTKALAALPEILGNKSIKDLKAVIAERRKKINERLTEIPSRIDELDKSLVDVSDYDVKSITAQILELDKEIQGIKDDTTGAKLRKQKAEMQTKLSELEMEITLAERKATKAIDDKIEALERELRPKKSSIKDALLEIARKEIHIKFTEDEMTRLRAEYAETAGKGVAGQESCPTCGQALPKDQVDAAIKKYNERQAQQLAEINGKGKNLKAENERLTAEIEEATKKGTANDAEIRDLEAQIGMLKFKPTNTEFNMDAILKINTELQEIEKKIEANLPPNTRPLEEERKTYQTMIAEMDATKKTKARIVELGSEEKKLATEYEDLERQIDLMDKFTVAKVGMLTEKINSKFSVVTWKLFEIQINQGVSECCTALVDGVPWDRGLNHGSQINAGIDIINTFSKHYGIKCPLWIDMSESITNIIPTECQMIKLKVDEKYKELKVENG